MAEGEDAVYSAASESADVQSPARSSWLFENGPKQLELLFRAIIYHPSAPILITDDDGNSRDASVGAGRLLGQPREKIIGRAGDEFADPAIKPQMSELWKALQEHGQQQGTLRRSMLRLCNCRATREWCAVFAIVMRGMRTRGGAARASARFPCTRPSPAWFPESLTASPR